MADDATKPKANAKDKTPDAPPPAAETTPPAADAKPDAKIETRFTEDPLKNAAGAAEGPKETPKPKRQPKPRKSKKAAAPEAASAEGSADAEAPADDAAAPEEQAAAPKAEDKPKAEEPAAPASPTAETAEEKEAREKAEAAAKAPQQPAQPTAETKKPEAITDEDLQGSKFAYNLNIFNEKHMPILNETWGVGTVDPELIKALGEEGEIRKHKNGLLFNLPNGHTIEWHHNFGGAEFIGMPRAKSKFDEEDAHAVVAAGKSRGWQALNVFGDVKQKEMMWLEAMRQGMGVANFEPMQDSPAFKQWMKESQANLDTVTVGAAPAEHGMPVLDSKFGGLPPAEPIDTPKQEAPQKQEAKADAPGTPADAKAPETKGPATPQGEGSFEEFIDRVAAGTKDPEVQKGLVAVRDLLKKDTSLDAGKVKDLLGDQPTPASYTAAAKFLETSGGDAAKALPKVEAPKVATVEPPATPPVAKARAPKAGAPAL